MTETPPDPAPTCYRHPGRETWIRCQRCEKPICPDCMVSAAVGFQCPDCVKQGAKQTRSGLAAYGGRRSANPQTTTIVLIAVNVVVWLVMQGNQLLDRLLPLLPDGRCNTPDGEHYFGGIEDAATCTAAGGDWAAGVADGAVWQLVTSGFAHLDLWHLALNMLALFFLGPLLEAALGRTRFLAVYGLSLLAASALVMLASDPSSQTLGASGAVFGLLGALLVVGLKVRGNMQPIVLWLGLLLVYTFTSPRDVSWQGHLGGLAGGALAAAVIAFAPKQRRSVVQWTGLGLLLLIVLVLSAGRAAAL